MKEQFNAAAQGVFGSGWTFLSLRPGDGVLVVETTSNQNLPDFNAPILCLDVWEHAYYLQYQNRRPEYIANWWSTVNWVGAHHHHFFPHLEVYLLPSLQRM